MREWSTLRKMMFAKGATGALLNEYTATGNPVTFNTNKAKPLTKLLCAWTPTQSGTGDPAPDNVRPISGMTGVEVWRTGKNLLNLNRELGEPSNTSSSKVDRTFDTTKYVKGLSRTNYYYPQYVHEHSVSTNGITLERYSAENDSYGIGLPVDVLSNQKYTINATLTNCKIGLTYYDKDGAYLTNVNIGSNVPYTLTTPTDARYLVITFVTDGDDATATNIMLNVGETASTYEPYHGTTYAVEFPALGKNLLNRATEVSNAYVTNEGKIGSQGSGWIASDYVPVEPNTQYTFQPNTTAGVSAKHAFYTEEKEFISFINSGEQTFTTPSNCYYMRFSYRDTSTDVMLNVGSSALPYEPYTNTVYGGTLDLTTGVLTATWVGVDAKSLQWQDSSQVERQVYSTNLSASGYSSRGLDDDTNIICDSYKTISAKTSISTMDDNGIKGNTTYGNTIYIRDTRYETRQDFKNNVDAFFAYELAEPINYQLTPTQVTALIGNNTIWSDANGDCEVKYLKKG